MRRKRDAYIGAFLVRAFAFSSYPIVYFHVSEAHAEQEPSTVAPEDEYPVPSYLEGLSQSKNGLRHLDACSFHTICATVKYTHSSPVLFTEIRISPVHWHDNERQGANSCLRYRLSPGKVVYDQLVKPSRLSHPVSLHLSFFSFMSDPNFSRITAMSLDPVTNTLADLQTYLAH